MSGPAVLFFLSFFSSLAVGLGPQCWSNPPNLDPNSGLGHVEKLGGLNTYISGSPGCKRAVLLVSDVYGYEAPLTRGLADEFAAAGFYAVLPDFFYGDPFVRENTKRPMAVWIKDHGTDKGFKDAKPVIDALKSKGVTAIGAAGFCWGGKVVVELNNGELIQATVLAHPSYVTVDDIKAVKVPIAILGAENDTAAPPKLVKQFEEILNAKPEVNSFVKIFPKVSHGWTIRYNATDETAVKRAEEAHQDMIRWFKKYVK